MRRASCPKSPTSMSETSTLTCRSTLNGELPTTSLYIGQLGKDVTETQLKDRFTRFGQLNSVRICIHWQSKEPLGFGFVNFKNADDARRAMEAMDGQVIGSQAIRIKRSHRDPWHRRSTYGSLVIKNLNPTVDGLQLKRIFSTYGEVMSCHVAEDDDGRSMGYGFVHFVDESSTAEAMSSVNGRTINGHRVVVERFLNRRERLQYGGESRANLFVSNIDEAVDDHQLRDEFQRFGPVVSAKIIRFRKSGQSRGFGFVRFYNRNDARRAVNEMNNRELNGKRLFVTIAHRRKRNRKSCSSDELSEINEPPKQQQVPVQFIPFVPHDGQLVPMNQGANEKQMLNFPGNQWMPVMAVFYLNIPLPSQQQQMATINDHCVPTMRQYPSTEQLDCWQSGYCQDAMCSYFEGQDLFKCDRN